MSRDGECIMKVSLWGSKFPKVLCLLKLFLVESLMSPMENEAT